MRNLLFFLCLSTLLFLGSALTIPKPKIPTAVLKAFSTAHPTVKKVVWTKDAEGFEAEFTQKRKSISIVYNTAGKLLETETNIPQNQLPKPVLPFILKNYSSYKITETALIQKETLTLYEVELKKGVKTFDLLFDDKGALWKK